MLKQRKTIALFVSEVEGDYSNHLCRGAMDCAEENDVNLVILPGKTVNSPYQYQYQYNIIYDLVNQDNVDALIIPLSVSHAMSSKEEIQRFCRRYFPLPIVTINFTAQGASSIRVDNSIGLRDAMNHLLEEHHRQRVAFIQGTPNNIDAEERFAVYCECLDAHGYTFDPNLVCPGDFTYYSAITAVNTLLDDRKVPFDAIVAANDEMALMVISELQKRGIGVPEDVAVVGFDNVDSSRLSRPSLTTVRQPVFEMGKKALELAIRLEQSGAPESVILGTELVIRESCGCKQKTAMQLCFGAVSEQTGGLERFVAEEIAGFESAALRPKMERFISRVFLLLLGSEKNGLNLLEVMGEFDDLIKEIIVLEEEVVRFVGFITQLRYEVLSRIVDDERQKEAGELFDGLRTALFLAYQRRNAQHWLEHNTSLRKLRGVLDVMVPYVNDKNAATSAAIRQLKELNIGLCTIYLYENECYSPKGQRIEMPTTVQRVASYSSMEMDPIVGDDLSIDAHEIIQKRNMPSDRRVDLILNPIFFLEDQMGFILCEFRIEDSYLYESLFNQMGCVLKFSYVLNAKIEAENQLRHALRRLEVYNEQLSNLSETDELTGLYNRRGFLRLAGEGMRRAYEMNRGGMLFYADLDGLKEINDTFGHEEGDNAIQQAASLLRKAFRHADIIARLGGDEFTVFTVDVSRENISLIFQRMDDLVKEYNVQSGKAYPISISMGAVAFDGRNGKAVEEIMAEADARLYQQKREKRLRGQKLFEGNDR